MVNAVIQEFAKREDIVMVNTTLTPDNEATFAEEEVQRNAKSLKELR